MSKKIMLKCGCANNAINMASKKPSCAIHGCDEVAEQQPNLEGREARCYCYKIVKSDINLPFFHYLPEYTYDEYYCGHDGWN